ncbi:hypothetical protein HY382_03115 [Candidatus Curtissbacteria bacterium]|nr:hypothetical protein [Candidatus Curtissbacteria bacterium]
MDDEEKNVKEIPLDPPPPEIPPKANAEIIPPLPKPQPNPKPSPTSDPRFVPITPETPPPSDLNSATPIGRINAQGFPTVGHTAPTQGAQATKPPPIIRNIKETSGGKSKIILALIAFLFIIIATLPVGLAYNNYKIYSPPKEVRSVIDSIISKTPLPKTPRIILSGTQTKMASLKTAVAKTTLEVSTGAKDYPFKSASLTVSGPLDFKEKKQTKSEAHFSGKLDVEGMSFSASAYVKVINKMLYFKINELPGGYFVSQFTDIKGKWYFVDIAKYKQEEVPDMDQAIEKIRTVFENYITKSHRWSKMKSTGDAYEIRITPPKNEIADFLYDLATVIAESDKSKLDKTLEKENLAEMVDKLDKFEIIVSVSKKTGYITKSEIVGGFTIPKSPSTSQNLISLAPQSPVPIEIKATTELSDFNQNVIMEVPENATDFEDYSKELQKKFNIPSFNESTPSPAPNQPTTFNNPLDPKNPVLGSQLNLLDMMLLNYLNPTLY